MITQFGDGSIDVKASYRKNKTLLIVITALLWFIIALYFALIIAVTFNELTPSFFFYVISCCASYCIVFEILQLCVLLLLTRERFMWLNDLTKILTEQNNDNPTDFSNRNCRQLQRESHTKSLISRHKSKFGLLQIGRLHDRLCCISKKIIKIYSAPVTITFFMVFISIISVSCFNIRTSFVYNSDEIDYPYYFLTVFIILFNFALFFITVKISSSASNQVKVI